MLCTCNYLFRMSAMIQIRNVPDALHRKLKSRAAARWACRCRDYLLDQLRTVAEQPTVEELKARLERLPPFSPSVSPAEAVRAERDRR